MPTPIDRRPVPDHVEIPVLPAGMQAWADFVTHLDPTHTVRRGQRELIVEKVTDGHSAARALKGYRYSGRGNEWVDEANGGRGDWRPEWIVIAVSELDPYFVDISKEALPVYSAFSDADAWKPRKVKGSLIEFIESMTVKAPVVYEPYVPPPPLERDSSVTVHDWGPRKEELQSALCNWLPGRFQPHTLARREQTPALLVRSIDRESAGWIMDALDNFGARGEIGAAVPRPPRTPRPAPDESA